MKERSRGGAHPSSDDIYKRPISLLLLLLDMKVKTEADNGSESQLEY